MNDQLYPYFNEIFSKLQCGLKCGIIWIIINLVPEAATWGVLWKKVFLEISQNSRENTCTRVSFFIKLQVSGLWHRCFPVNFVKFLRTFFTEHLWTTASVVLLFAGPASNILNNSLALMTIVTAELQLDNNQVLSSWCLSHKQINMTTWSQTDSEVLYLSF